MDVGIGLPNAVPGTTGKQLTEFARTAERCGFPALGTIDRLVYPNHEPLIALGAAAAVTERIRLMTSILITPYRLNTALLAKQLATLHVLSEGRLEVGVGLGAREDDYQASGAGEARRGSRIGEQIEEIRRIWGGEERGFAGPIGPAVDGGPPIIVGGHADAALRRAARLGDGWMMGGGTPDQFAELSEKVKGYWGEEGRDGAPPVRALAYFALGPEGSQKADWALKDYYGVMGEETAAAIAASAATDQETVRQYMEAFEQAGCDELILFSCGSEPEQVELLAEAVGK